VTEESAFRPALGKLGNSCKECHQTYRRPKQR
jgi:cytochrome c556